MLRYLLQIGRAGADRSGAARGGTPHSRRALSAVKGLDSFEFEAIPSLNKMLVLELARGEYILSRENVIALGNSGTGKSHIALASGSPPASAAWRSDLRPPPGLSIS